MTGTIGKAFVRQLYPDAKLEWSDGRHVIVYYDGSDLCDLGEGKTPEEAWHDAAVEAQASLAGEANSSHKIDT